MTSINLRFLITLLAAVALLVVSLVAFRGPILGALAWNHFYAAMAVAARA